MVHYKEIWCSVHLLPCSSIEKKALRDSGCFNERKQVYSDNINAPSLLWGRLYKKNARELKGI